MRKHLTVAILAIIQFLTFAACSETKEFDDHANWESRNRSFIDSMADSCEFYRNMGVDRTNAEVGQMFRLLSFTLDPEKDWKGSGSYVYCRVLAKGEGDESPYYTDSVRINYRARLIPTQNYPEGQIVDHSYKTDSLDPGVNVPASFKVSGLIGGVSTALLHMHTGDHWMLYIPLQLAYGSSAKNNIPAYSALMFEINLTQFARTGSELPPR
ncbi:MAG: FKBP-type peptidyl-prolyl cis-trans isomerase [Bacteroidaceae bacterium]|nr:FKBP-type peptidyl-prolyl cis-trans isomerase [Bacteroidaceae bacterium]